MNPRESIKHCQFEVMIDSREFLFDTMIRPSRCPFLSAGSDKELNKK